MANNVVPFGKYKGQPVEAMAADRDYVDWLLAQSWFKDKHQNIYTLIINNFAEPSETPEHNALQALFLDDVFVQKFIAVYHTGIVYSNAWRDSDRDLTVSFEKGGADVYIRLCGVAFAVEIKPSIGDDYPAVLRQIRNTSCSGIPVLFLEKYIGVGATKAQFVSVFGKSGVCVVFRDDVERQNKIDWSVLDEARRSVDAAKEEFNKNWCTGYIWGTDRLRIDHKEFYAVFGEQEDLLREAIRAGDDEEIRIHSAAMVRAWQAASRVLEDAEIEKAKAVLPDAVIRIREKRPPDVD